MCTSSWVMWVPTYSGESVRPATIVYLHDIDEAPKQLKIISPGCGCCGDCVQEPPLDSAFSPADCLPGSDPFRGRCRTMQSDRSYWNAKFEVGDNQLLPPEPFLVRNVHAFRPGSVLDLACGDGRNAIHLAKLSFAVTAVDISDIALGVMQSRWKGLRRLLASSSSREDHWVIRLDSRRRQRGPSRRIQDLVRDPLC
jgi:Tellurite resistance protein TehB